MVSEAALAQFSPTPKPGKSHHQSLQLPLPSLVFLRSWTKSVQGVRQVPIAPSTVTTSPPTGIPAMGSSDKPPLLVEVLEVSKKLRKEATAVMLPDNWLGDDDGAIDGGVVDA
jgi:hypothetical protein